MADGATPPGSDWRGWLAYILVALFGLFMDWARRRMNRHEDELDRRSRRGRIAHRRHDDPAGRWHSHDRGDRDTDEWDEDEEG